MDPRKLHDSGLDERLAIKCCVYCGGAAETADHVPWRILLDDPFPANLPVVPACQACNQSFASDEEYLACFLECVLQGSAVPNALNRPKVRDALSHSPRLAAQLAGAATTGSDYGLVWTPERQRVEKVLVKLARGHAAHELSSIVLDAPESLSYLPVVALTPEERSVFESGPQFSPWPEIGSRAFLRAAGVHPHATQDDWVVVQSGRYRYSVDEGGPIVRMVLSEYLACGVEWA